MVGSNMSSKLTREAIYDLRRLLIGRLQVATRGVPRSQRVEGLQTFARGWQDLRSVDRLEELALLMDHGNSGASLPSIFLTLAQVTEQVSPNLESDTSRSFSRPVPLSRGAVDGGPNSKPWWVGTRQEELFPAGLATQPV